MIEDGANLLLLLDWHWWHASSKGLLKAFIPVGV